MSAEGESRSSGVCCPLSSTVCSRVVGDGVLSADCRQDKTSSKLSDLAAAGIYSERLTMNSSDVTCCRVDEHVVLQGTSRSGGGSATSDAAAADSETLHRGAGRQQTQTTTESVSGHGASAVRQPTPSDDNRQTPSDGRRPHDAALNSSQAVGEQSPVAGGHSAVSHKSDWESSPETVRLLAQLIGKISELATRQDQLERTRRPCGQRVVANKTSQTDNALREAAGDAATSQRILGSSINELRRDSLDEPAVQSSVSRYDEQLSTTPSQTKNKQRGAVKSAKCSKQTISSSVPVAAKRAVQTTPRNDDASEPTKLTSCSATGQQADEQLTSEKTSRPPVGLDDIDVAVEEERPPSGQSVRRSPLAAITDNIVHIVRGSSALVDVSVDELLSQYTSEPAAPQPPAADTEAHSKPVHQSKSPVSSRTYG